MDDRTLKRSGLDYWEHVKLSRHIDLHALYKALPRSRFVYLTTKADRSYIDWRFEPADCMIFGPETRGLPMDVLEANWERCLTIPMQSSNVRSLNLSTSAGIVLYEAIRQLSAGT